MKIPQFQGRWEAFFAFWKSVTLLSGNDIPLSFASNLVAVPQKALFCPGWFFFVVTYSRRSSDKGRGLMRSYLWLRLTTIEETTVHGI